MESASSTRVRPRRFATAGVVQLVRGSGFIFACRVSGAVLAFVSQLALARWMGASELGRYLLAFSWCILLARLAGLGYNSAAVRFIGEGLALGEPGVVRGFIRSTRRVVRRVSALVALAGAVAVLVLARRSGASPWAFLLAFAAVPLMAGVSLWSGFANSLSWFRLAFVPNSVVRPLLFLMIMTLLWGLDLPLHAGTAMMANACAILVTLCTLGAIMRRLLRRSVGDVVPVHHVRLWTRTAVPMLVISLFVVYLPELSVIMAGLYVPADQLAIFTVSYRVALLIAFGIEAVEAFIRPGAAQAWASRDREELQRLVTRATLLQFGGALAGTVFLALFGHRVLGIFGAEFVGGYPILMMLATAQLARAAIGPVTSLLNMSGHQDECLRVFAVSLVVVAGLIAVCAPLWGIHAVAIVITSVIIASSVILRFLVIRHLGVRPSLFTCLGAR